MSVIPDYVAPASFPNDINYVKGRENVVSAFNKAYKLFERLLTENEKLMEVGEDDIYEAVLEENGLSFDDYNNTKPIPDNIYESVLSKIENELQRDGVYSPDVMNVVEDVIYKYNYQNKRHE